MFSDLRAAVLDWPVNVWLISTKHPRKCKLDLRLDYKLWRERQQYSCATLDRDDANTREVFAARTIDPCRHFWHSPYNISISMWHSESYRLKYRSYTNSGCVVSLTSRRRVSDRGGRALRDVGRPPLGRTSPAQPQTPARPTAKRAQSFQ